MKIFVINGFPKTGKSLFCEYYKEITDGWSYEYSSVDFVKEIAKNAGWDGVKDNKNRKFLSDLKDLLTEWNDIPYKKIEKYVKNIAAMYKKLGVDDKNVVIFIHCREPLEIKKIVEKLGAKTLLIRRLEVEKEHQSNHADANVLDYIYDYTICNNYDKDFLMNEAKEFAKLVQIMDWDISIKGEELCN